jgi:predicted transcriptional regulator of viral defense system
MNKLSRTIEQIPKSYFSLNDLAKLSDLNKNSLKVSISRAINNGSIIPLVRGLYTNRIAQIPWENLAVNIYHPSYISFESALNYYNILSQQSSAITLATSKRRKEINIQGQIISYRHLRSQLFWGYTKKDDYLIAEAEKAFLDLAYLSLNGYAHFDSSEMNLELLNRKKLKNYLKRFNNKKLNKLINQII